MTARGVLLQVEKSFYHSRKALFREIPYVDGFPQEHTFISSISAPPGGSKGSVTWASQPAAMRGDPEDFVRPPRASLWKCSPYFHLWKALYALGAPLGAPEMYGGINLPILPKASTRYHFQWLSYMNSRTLADLLIGTGLAPSTGAGRSLTDDLARKWLTELQEQNKQVVAYNRTLRTEPVVKRIFRWKVPPSERPVKDPNDPEALAWGEWRESTLLPQSPLVAPLTTSPDDPDGNLRLSLRLATRNAMGKLRSSEFYFRTPIDVRTPSARLYLDKFVRKVSTAPAIPGSYSSLSEDIMRKLCVFLTRRSTMPEAEDEDDQTSFGLERSGPIRRRLIAPTYHVEA